MGKLSTANKEITLFPNPVKDKLTLSLNSFDIGKSVDVFIYDLAGRRMDKVSATGGSDLLIEVSHLATGNYLLKAQQGRQIKQVQFIKE